MKKWKFLAYLEIFFVPLSLKGTVSRDFCFWFFSSISFPPAPEYPIRTVSNLFENSRRYSQLNIDQMRKIINQKNFNIFVRTPLDSRVNIYINFCLQVHFEVSAAWYRWQICHRCQRYRRKRCSNKIIKIFLIEDFFHLPPVSATPVVNLELQISQRLLEKIRNGPNGILWGWGETDS